MMKLLGRVLRRRGQRMAGRNMWPPEHHGF